MRTEFNDCDDFASYVLNECFEKGYEATEESNKIMKTVFPIGADMIMAVQYPEFVNSAKESALYRNFNNYRTLRAYLYDIYELFYKVCPTDKETILAPDEVKANDQRYLNNPDYQRILNKNTDSVFLEKTEKAIHAMEFAAWLFEWFEVGRVGKWLYIDGTQMTTEGAYQNYLSTLEPQPNGN